MSGQVTDGELRGIEQLESKGVPGTDPVLRKHNGEPFDVSGQLTVGPGAIGCRVDHGKRIAESVQVTLQPCHVGEVVFNVCAQRLRIKAHERNLSANV